MLKRIPFPRSEKGWEWMGVLFLLALGMRWIYLEEIERSPFFDVPVGDARTYLDRAVQTTQGSIPAHSPLYPYFLGGLYRIGGKNFYVLRLVQFLIGSLSCVLVYAIGRRAFGRGVGMVAGLMAAGYGISIYLEGEFLPTALASFLNLALVLVLLWAAESVRWWRWLSAGVLFGLSALTVTNTLLFAPFVLLWMVLGKPSAPLPLCPSAGGQGALIFLMGIGLVLVPGALRDVFVGKDFTLLSGNVGVHFYLGNNPDYDRTVRIRPGSEWRRLISMPKEEGSADPSGRTRTKGVRERTENVRLLSDRSRVFFRKSWKFISAHPLGYVRLLLKKLGLFWWANEIERNGDIYFSRRYSKILSVLLWKHGADTLHPLAFPFGLLGPLALTGMALALRRRREPGISLLLLFVLMVMISVVLFFVCARSRAPVLPFLMIFAGYALWWGYERVRERAWKRLVGPAVWSAALIGVVHIRVGAMNMEGDAETHYNLAVAYEQKGMTANALSEVKKSAALDPNYFEARYALGRAFARQGRYDDAIIEYRKAIKIDPEYAPTWRDLARTYVRKKEYDSAVETYREVIRRTPNLWEVRYQLGRVYVQAGRTDEAIAAYGEAIRLDATRTEVHGALAFAYDQKGQYDRSFPEYKEALRLDPNNRAAQNNLGIAYTACGMLDEAVAQFQQVLHAEPTDLGARYNLANVYVKQGKTEEAISEYRQIVRANPDYEEGRVFYDLALAYKQVGQQEQAQAAMKRYEGYARRTVREVLKSVVEGAAREWGAR